MPDNIDGLLNDLGAVQEAPVEDNQTAESTTAEPEVTNTEDPTIEAEQPQDVQSQIEAQRQNQAFAAMRAENNKYKKFMQTLMRGSNFAGDEAGFMSALEEEAYKKQAQLQGMAANPELLRKMDQQEEQIKALTESQKDQNFLLGLKTLQQANNLTGKEVEAFVQKAIENKIDLMQPGVNFDTIYKGMFFDDILTKRIEEARQSWIKQSAKADSAATPDSKSGKQESSQSDVKTMAEFNSLLNTVSKNI